MIKLIPMKKTIKEKAKPMATTCSRRELIRQHNKRHLLLAKVK